MVDEQTIQEQKESVKLSINAKGNFQWEIKVYGTGLKNIFTEDDKKRLDDINKEMETTYGQKE